MEDKNLYYAVTRVHSQELGLLSKQDLQQLLDAETLEDCFTLLESHGWGDPSLPALDTQALLAFEEQKIWTLMEELMGDVKPFYVFRYSHDFNNLKAAIKLSYANRMEEDNTRYFMPFGTIPVAQLLEAAESHQFGDLPYPMNEAAQKAYEALAHTGSGQSCDVILDAACLQMIDQAGKESGNELLEMYATTTVDMANIKTAIRSYNMGKGNDFLEIAIPDCGSLDVPVLRRAAISGKEAIYTYLETTDYRTAVPELRKSMAAFERWCDDLLMEKIRPQRYAIGGIEPLAAFVLARQNEINMVRLILSAKVNRLDPVIIGERMREMYV